MPVFSFDFSHLLFLFLGALFSFIFMFLRMRYLQGLHKMKWQLEKEHLEEKLSLLENIKEQLGHHFQDLSQDSLEKNSRQFLNLALGELEKQQLKNKGDLTEQQHRLKELILPMKQVLENVEKRHHEIGKQLSENSSQLKEQLAQLTLANHQLQSETGKLVKALRTPQVRGRWGEMTLKRVAELAGMVEHCDFFEQVQKENLDEQQIRPDMIVHLPNGRQIVIDAKTPLQAYLDALEEQDEKKSLEHLRRHCQQLQKHMKQLAGKSHWSQFPESPEFVVMFVPGENFFSAACDQHPGLIEEGMRQGVILATPTTLISLLKAVGYGWRQEQLASNAKKISQLGRELYHRLGHMAGHFGKFETHMKRSLDAYNKAIGSMENRVLASARRFKELGVDSAEEISSLEPLDIHPRPITAEELANHSSSFSLPENETLENKALEEKNHP
jgi:DNA recombination protein RmuC